MNDANLNYSKNFNPSTDLSRDMRLSLEHERNESFNYNPLGGKINFLILKYI